MKEPFTKFIESELGPDIVLITCGLPASWKTETAEEVQKINGYPIVRSDLVRLEVLKGEDIFDERIASDMNKRLKVYDEVFRQAGELAAKGRGVILDATFVTQKLRIRAAEVAATNNRTFVIMQTSCPPVDENDMLDTTFRSMKKGKCPVLPVMREGKLVGLVTLENVGEWMMAQSAQRRQRA